MPATVLYMSIRFNYGDEVGLEQAQNSEALLLRRVMLWGVKRRRR